MGRKGRGSTRVAGKSWHSRVGTVRKPRKEAQPRMLRPVQVFADVEEMLAAEVAAGMGRRISSKAMLFPSIIYSSSHALRELAYSKGYSFGRMVFQRSSGGIRGLEAALDGGGLRKPLYRASAHKAIISAAVRPCKNIGGRIHYFEAGMIAGYMSASTGRHLEAVEMRCAGNGDPECSFHIGPAGTIARQKAGDLSPMELVSKIAGCLGVESAKDDAGEPYYISVSAPLCNGGLAAHTAAIARAAGEKAVLLAGMGKHTDTQIKEMFALEGVHSSNSGKRTLVVIEHSHLGSSKGIADVPVGFVAGMAEGAGRNASAANSVRNGKYISNVKIW